MTPANHLVKTILEHWNEEREQIAALAYSLENNLAPADPENPEDIDNLTAWRIAQVITKLLASTRDITALREWAAREAAHDSHLD